MDISSLFTTILQISIGCTIVYFALNFLKQRQKDLVASEIKNLEARMASLRMILKAKVKKKSQYFRATVATPVKQGDPFDLAMTSLADIPFEANEEFEKYFSLSKQLNTLMKSDAALQKSHNDEQIVQPAPTPVPSTTEPTSDFMTGDIKNEFIIIKTIHEMITLSVDLKAKVEQFNLMNPKTPLADRRIIQFASVVDVEKIFSINAPETIPAQHKAAA